MKNILQIENLSISFRTDEGTFNMIKDLSYSVGEGEIVGIVGESGCGKTISSLCTMGLLLYSIPGTGGLLIDVIQRQDNTMVQTLVLLYAAIGIIGMFLGDLLMALLDPRISFVKKGDDR